MKVLSVSRELPTASKPAAGIHVARRLKAMHSKMDLTVLEVPLYFPWIRPKPPNHEPILDEFAELNRYRSAAIYTPGIAHAWHGWFMSRAISEFLDTQHENYDMVDAHFGFPEGVAAFEAISKKGIPLAVTFRGLETDLPRDGMLGSRMRRALSYASHCICVSQSLAEVAEQLGAHPHKIAVVPNAVNSEQFKPGDKLTSRTKVDIAADIPMLVSVGHLRDVKRQHILLQSFELLLEHFPKAQLFFIGSETQEADYTGKLKAYVKTQKLETHVHFLGILSPELVHQYLVASDVFVLLSRREGSCNAVLEALASGTPAIVTAAGENQEIINENQNGYVVDYDNPEQTAQSIARSFSSNFDPQLISQSIAHRKWDQVGSDLLNLFSSEQGKVQCASR